MILKRLWLAAAVLIACVPPTMAGAAAAESDPSVIVVPAGTAPDTPPGVAVLLANDPPTCMNGGEFVRYEGEPGDAAGFVCGRNGPELSTLFPMTNIELARLVLGRYAPKFISTIFPRETGGTWRPNAVTQSPGCLGLDHSGRCVHLVNGYGCRNWTQLCSKQGYANRLGYSWAEANYAYPAMLITRMLIDESVAAGKDPYTHWRCSRCSLR